MMNSILPGVIVLLVLACVGRIRQHIVDLEHLRLSHVEYPGLLLPHVAHTYWNTFCEPSMYCPGVFMLSVARGCVVSAGAAT